MGTGVPPISHEIAHACNEGLGVPVLPVCTSTRRAIFCFEAREGNPRIAD